MKDIYYACIFAWIFAWIFGYLHGYLHGYLYGYLLGIETRQYKILTRCITKIVIYARMNVVTSSEYAPRIVTSSFCPIWETRQVARVPSALERSHWANNLSTFNKNGLNALEWTAKWYNHISWPTYWKTRLSYFLWDQISIFRTNIN